MTVFARRDTPPTMLLRFWGVRGSIPTPGPQTQRYGGNTPCVSIEFAPGKVLVLDAGTGIRALGEHLAGRDAEIYVLLTHGHWDHIQGFPFFAPIYQPGRRVHLFAPESGLAGFDALLGQMDGAHFPVAPDQIRAMIQVITGDATDFLLSQGVCVSTLRVNHPGGAVGYRIDHGGRAVVYIPDNELDPPPQPYASDAPQRDDEPAADDHFAEPGREPAPLHAPVHPLTIEAAARFCQRADVLIHDAMYTPEQMPARRGWGHSTVAQACDLAARAHVRHLVLFHHDPARTDGELDKLRDRAADELLARASEAYVSCAMEGEVLPISARDEWVRSGTNGPTHAAPDARRAAIERRSGPSVDRAA